MAVDESVLVRTDALRIGCILQHPINDAAGRLLLAGGARITVQIRDAMRRRGINSVLLHADDVSEGTATRPSTAADGVSTSVQRAKLAKDLSQAASSDASVQSKMEALAATASFVIENTGAALRDSVTTLGTVPYDRGQRDRLVAHFNAANELMSRMIDSLLQGARLGASELASVVTNTIPELTQDSGHAISVADEKAQQPGSNPRSVRMSVLAMAMAIEMDYDAENVRQVGLAGLMQDWGLFCLSERLRNPAEPLTRDDWLSVMQHPIHTVRLLEQVSGIPKVVPLVCYQVHEIPDGSGYPHGRRGKLIHCFARILAVADAYISLLSQIRGRPAVIPYDAILYLLHQVQAGKFDADAVRALLRALSMFPVGSYVQLSDGTDAKVIRANSSHYRLPVVQRLTDEEAMEGHEQNGPVIVDLAKDDLEVRRPLATPGRKEMRLPTELMDEVFWDGPDF